MSLEGTMGGLSGAAQGAQAGLAVGGPWGAVVGGIIGGAAGLIGGNKASAARRQLRKANKIDMTRKTRENAIVRRDMVRDFRMKRAMQVAASFTESGGNLSSTVQTAMGSLGSQWTFNRDMFDWTSGANKQINKHLQKANSLSEQSQMISAGISMVSSMVTSGAGAYKTWKAGQTPSTSSPSTQPGPWAGGYSFPSPSSNTVPGPWSTGYGFPVGRKNAI